jgi:SAM-dependent methyltransferase
MSDTASQFVGSVPQIYDTCLGPLIFIDYAKEIAGRAKAFEPSSVLELAAGTGIVSRQLRNSMASACALTVTDLNEPMLEIARAKFTDNENVSFHQADAMVLPFEDNSQDLIVSQFGVMFFPGKVEAFKEARRVLRQDGHILFNVWGAMFANPFAEIAHGIGMETFPDDPPEFYNVPFSYHNVDQVSADLRLAGFKNISHDVIKISKTVTDWTSFAHGLVYGNPLEEEIRKRGGPDPEAVKARIEAAMIDRFGPGPSAMPLEALVFQAQG